MPSACPIERVVSAARQLFETQALASQPLQLAHCLTAHSRWRRPAWGAKLRRSSLGAGMAAPQLMG
jgi:hypothetical protein